MLFKYYVYVMSVSEVFVVCLDGRHRVMSVSEVFKATNTCVMFVCQ